MTASRLGATTRGGWRLRVRWMVLASLLVSVFALHALADHDAVGVRHASVAGPVATSTFAGDAQTPPRDANLAAAAPFTSVAAPAQGPDGWAATCILFLASVAWVLALAALYALRRRGSVAAGRGGSGRPIPGVHAPPGCPINISLCVLRV